MQIFFCKKVIRWDQLWGIAFQAKTYQRSCYFPNRSYPCQTAPQRPDDLFACLPLCLSTLTRCHAKYLSIMSALLGLGTWDLRPWAIQAVQAKCIAIHPFIHPDNPSLELLLIQFLFSMLFYFQVSPKKIQVRKFLYSALKWVLFCQARRCFYSEIVRFLLETWCQFKFWRCALFRMSSHSDF